MDRLVGRRALITGGGRGLGRAIALAFAAEGADVVVSFRRSGEGAGEVVRAAEALGVRAEAVRADLLDAEQIDRLAAAAAAALGGLDILVSNAGLYSSRPLLETTDDLWERLLAVNLTAPFRLARLLGPAMLAAGGGVIVFLASTGGLHPRPVYGTSPAYAASKAGLVMLTRKLALELAPSVRVNCIAPGVVDSRPGGMTAEARGRYAAATPLGRVGRPEEVAAAAVFLASEESAPLTGQVLAVDGGLIA